ncbi:MAG: aldo/keto reductase [Thermomicrobiales bacterium]|nr:aldo/keto reductase [Thermomicrobiales bacterium]
METRTAGLSELRLTRIGLGLAALGRPGYVNLGHASDLDRNYDVAAMRDHAATVLDAAWNAGIRYFDAARSYGRAEEFLAHWLTTREIRPDQITIGSKWGYTYTADWRIDADIHEVKDHTLPTLQRQIGESAATLGDWIDLYQIHSATIDSGVLDRSDVLDALAALRAERGWAIGLSLSGASSRETLERALDIQRDSTRLFSAVQATWNILEPSLSDILADAHRAGLAVIAKETLGNGRLTNRNDYPEFAASREVLNEQAERLGCTIDQLALAAVLDNDWIDCVLSGAATTAQLESNVGACMIRLDDDARVALARLAESPATYWSNRSGLKWN